MAAAKTQFRELLDRLDAIQLSYEETRDRLDTVEFDPAMGKGQWRTRPDATFSRTSPNAFGKLANEARREKSEKERGADYKVYALTKSGARRSKPFGPGDWYTKDEAEAKKRYWEGLNAGTKFEIVKER